MRGGAETEQACRLGGDRVRGDQLLLLADRVEEAERVRTEADHPDEHDRREPAQRRQRRSDPPAGSRLAEREERQHEPGAQLHRDPRGERRGGRPRSRGRPGAQQQRQRQRRDQPRVVVGSPDREHHEHRVQAEEHGGEGGRAAEALGRARGQPHGGEAEHRARRFEGPQRAGQPERRRRVAREREQRSVRRVLEGPADEPVDGIGRSFRREMRVRIEPVQRAHARIHDVPEDVLGDQRWAEHDDHVRREDRRGQPPQRDRAGARKREQVAAADDQHQGLERTLAERRAGTGQRAREPARPAAAVGGHVPARRLRGVEHQDRERSQHRDDRDAADDAAEARAARPRRSGGARARARGRGRGSGGRVH
jgi:hypothetical protein